MVVYMLIVALGVATVVVTYIAVGKENPDRRMAMGPRGMEAARWHWTHSTLSLIGYAVAILAGTRLQHYIGLWAVLVVFGPLLLGQTVVVALHNGKLRDA